MALLVLTLGVLASNEQAHLKLHHGEASNHSTCAVCAVAKGLVDASSPTVPLTARELSFTWVAPICYSAFIPEADFSVASSRGPPAAISSL